MIEDEEVIDVEEYHRNLLRSKHTLERIVSKHKEETQVLKTKLNRASHANDALHRQLYEKHQQQHRVAALLGFDDLDAVEANITQADPWISGSRSRILALEERLAKTEAEAEALRSDEGKLLRDAQEEAGRLRRERDFARREAERHAEDAQTCHEELLSCRSELRKCQDELQLWRNEINTRLPEMQALLREQLPKSTLVDNACTCQKENIGRQELDNDTPPFGDLTNIRSSQIKSSLPILKPMHYIEDYKKKYNLLEMKYNDLLALKQKVSRRYFEDLKRWKRFKEWLVKDQHQTSRGGLRRRKVMEKVGPKIDLGPTGGKHGPEDSCVVLLDPTRSPRKGAEDAIEKNGSSVEKGSHPPPSPFVLHASSQGLLAPQESLTQASSIPPASQELPSFERSDNVSREPPVSQSSMTQQSSPLPVVQKACVGVRIADNQPKDAPHSSGQSEGPILPTSNESPSKDQNDSLRGPKTPRCIRLSSTGFSKEFARSSNDSALRTPKAGVERTTTILAADTPQSGSPVYHHSLPIGSSPGCHSATSPSSVRKRKAAEMEDKCESTKQRGRERRRKQSHKEEMAKYMSYKGRGRYSNTKDHSRRTINNEFEIDPELNDGVSHQFDGVVRDRMGRKSLTAVDCECCRDYYEALGPLPSHLKPPKWKSPHNKGAQSTSSSNHRDGANQSYTLSPSPRKRAIESHRHEISRHRHDWAPPTTPPGYWRIGFPDTQEVEDINRQANDINARKLRQIETEVNLKIGKYRKKK